MRYSLLLVSFLLASCTFENIRVPPVPIEVKTYEEITAHHAHKWSKKAHPVVGAAVIDVDHDGLYEVFVGGGKDQADALLQYQNNELVNIIETHSILSSLATTYGIVAIDVDNNGFTDLIVAREDGVHFYLNDQGSFTHKPLNIPMPADTTPLAIAVADINEDGHIDLYVSLFVDVANFRSPVFNDPTQPTPNKI